MADTSDERLEEIRRIYEEWVETNNYYLKGFAKIVGDLLAMIDERDKKREE